MSGQMTTGILAVLGGLPALSACLPGGQIGETAMLAGHGDDRVSTSP